MATALMCLTYVLKSFKPVSWFANLNIICRGDSLNFFLGKSAFL